MALNSFKDASKLVEKVFKQNAVNYQTNFSALMTGAVAADTPVDSGRAKGAWDASDTNPIAIPHRRLDKSFGGERARERAFSQLPENAMPSMGRVVFIKNGVQGDNGDGYIIKLEHGKSKQAPLGMVFVNVAGRSKSISRRARKTI